MSFKGSMNPNAAKPVVHFSELVSLGANLILAHLAPEVSKEEFEAMLVAGARFIIISFRVSNQSHQSTKPKLSDILTLSRAIKILLLDLGAVEMTHGNSSGTFTRQA